MTSILIDRNDGLSSATAIKGPVRVATTAGISLIGLQTIDGVLVVSGDRVLVKNQSVQTQNGIYVADTGPWRRARDFSRNNDVREGTQVYVTDGTLYHATGWYVATDNPIAIGVTNIIFAQNAYMNADQLNALLAAAQAAADEAEAAAAAALGAVPNVFSATRTAMKALNTATITASFLKESGREGQFFLANYSDYAAQVSADPQEGVYVRSTFDPTKVWVRDGSWALTGKDIRWFGARAGVGFGAANKVAIQAAVDTRGLVVIPDDRNGDFEINDSILVRSNTRIRWNGSFLKLTSPSSIGGVMGAYHEGPVGAATGPSSNIMFDNPLIDGGNLGYVTGATYGENGIGGAYCRNVQIRGGIIKNCRHGASNRVGTGGKGIQIEADVRDCSAEGTLIMDCTIGVETGGDASVPPYGSGDSASKNMAYRDLTMVRCDVMISLVQANTPPSTSPAINGAVIDGVTAYNCGRETAGANEAAKKAFGAICIDRYAHCSIRNVVLVNDSTYGRLGAVIRQYVGYAAKIDIDFSGDTDALIDHKTLFPGAGSVGGRTICHYQIHHRWGEADNGILSDALAPAACTYDLRFATLNVACFDSSSAQAGNYGRFRNLVNTNSVEGPLNQIFAVTSGGFGSAMKTEVGARIFANGRVTMTTSTLSPISLSLNTYADNAAALAAGLTPGMQYKKLVGSDYQTMTVG